MEEMESFLSIHYLKETSFLSMDWKFNPKTSVILKNLFMLYNDLIFFLTLTTGEEIKSINYSLKWC